MTMASFFNRTVSGHGRTVDQRNNSLELGGLGGFNPRNPLIRLIRDSDNEE